MAAVLDVRDVTNQVEILKGLREGEEVVLHPSEAVVEGVRIVRR